jgi:putative transcriptional regulator
MPPVTDDAPHSITVHLDEMLAARGMTMTALAERVGITLANMSILKTGKAKAIRFSTLSAICAELDCQPGDILRHGSTHISGQV